MFVRGLNINNDFVVGSFNKYANEDIRNEYTYVIKRA
jgi:hypothetical protein